MKTMFRGISVSLALLLLASIFALSAHAQCGVVDGQGAFAATMLGRSMFSVGFQAASNMNNSGRTRTSIVGFWRVTFTSKGTPGIPDGAVIDVGFSQWHSDGTEILNSLRPPVTGSFCLGIWEKTAPKTYKLNHFALSWDPVGNFIGPANIRENVTLGPGGNSYTGSFEIDNFDVNGNPAPPVPKITGEVTAIRITVDTAPSDLFPWPGN
jgi:hypothetical protein